MFVSKSRLAGGLCVGVLITVTATAATAPPRDPSGRAEDRLIVKFIDDARVRLRASTFVSERGVDLTGLASALAAHGRPAASRLLARDEDAVEATRLAARVRDGRDLPDLNAYFELAVAPSHRDRLLEALRALPVVETVYRPAALPPPPGDVPPPTPDGEADQLFLDPAPVGIDAEWAWTRAGGHGEGIKLADIEYSWRVSHEDLDAALGSTACYTPGTQYIEHGTAVLGELVAGRNGYGVSGIVYAATPKLVTNLPNGMTYSVARAVDCATAALSPGDVMLIEAQTYGPRDRDGDGTNDLVPVEWDAAEYDAIRIAVAAGIVVIEPAGNGNEDLDDPVFGGAFNRATRDSGAILVGASSTYYGPGPDLSRADFSTYGSRVDIQGWGDDVPTTGYGDYFDGGGDPNQYYTAAFSGTSAAAPMGAGAAVAIQGVQKACGGAPLTPPAIRSLLVDTGTPQTTGPYPGHIGPRPDLRAALARVDVDNDGDTFKECQGDCDDAHAATRPGAAETNDGLDNQCPGAAGYGVVDETSGDSGFHNAANKNEYSWPAQAGATSYQVARSTRRDFASGCTKWDTTATSWNDTAVPTVGSLFYYLNRPTAPHVGSWGARSSGVERTSVCP